MSFGIPIAFVLVVLEWGYLCLRMRPPRTAVKTVLGVPERRPWAFNHSFVTVITVLTIVLWGLESVIVDILGNIGITALIPVVAFFGSGLLDEQDFRGLRWHTLALMGGGLALGEAMTESNLLTLFRDVSMDLFEMIPLWPLLFVTLVVTGIFASLINSTAASAILYPFIRVIGDSHGCPQTFVVLSAMMISSAQLFHMSSFANALVASVLRHNQGMQGRLTKDPFIDRRDFPIQSWPVTLIVAPLIVSSLGYGICLLNKLDSYSS
jgi:phosphate transporter